VRKAEGIAFDPDVDDTKPRSHESRIDAI